MRDHAGDGLRLGGRFLGSLLGRLLRILRGRFLVGGLGEVRVDLVRDILVLDGLRDKDRGNSQHGHDRRQRNAERGLLLRLLLRRGRGLHGLLRGFLCALLRGLRLGRFRLSQLCVLLGVLLRNSVHVLFGLLRLEAVLIFFHDVPLSAAHRAAFFRAFRPPVGPDAAAHLL